MKKLLFITFIGLVACNGKMKESDRLKNELDSTRVANEVISKYLDVQIKLINSGATEEEAKKYADSMYVASNPNLKGAPWNVPKAGN